jgi:hypothetical protein
MTACFIAENYSRHRLLRFDFLPSRGIFRERINNGERNVCLIISRMKKGEI